jgi:hypothetical protein
VVLAPGTRLGPYEIVAALGVGGMGKVHHARRPALRAMANKGASGFFDAPGGALISADGETISRPSPVVVDATTLKGDGWTATVGPRWTVQPGPDRDRSASCGNDQVPPDVPNSLSR